MKLRHLIRREDGAVALEMAFVAPLLLLLMFGSYDFGTLFVNSMEVEHATQAGATHALAVSQGGGTISLSDIQTAVTASTPLAVTVGVDPKRPSLTFCGHPAADGNSVVTDTGTPPCPTGTGTYLSIIGSATPQKTLRNWAGFPTTLATKIMIRLQ